MPRSIDSVSRTELTFLLAGFLVAVQSCGHGSGEPTAQGGAATPGAAATMTKSRGDLQSGPVSASLATPLSVTITDASNNVVPGVTVNWTAVTGGGSMGAQTSVTNALGVATMIWTLGPTQGPQTATATVTGLTGSPAAFSATASAATPAFTLASLAAGSGWTHTCGLTAAGAAYCWGNDSIGQLGSGDTISRSTPTPVVGGLVFASLAPGYRHTCGLTAGGAAYCWGDNSIGQLGDGTTTERHTPTPVAGGLVFASLTAATLNTCGLTTGGAAYCWGENQSGVLAVGTLTNPILTPKPVVGGLVFASLSPGGDHNCGLTAGGVAYCWGDNDYGEVGNGTTGPRTGVQLPAPVAGGLVFASLAPGFFHTCGLTTAHAVYCWGYNFYGQVGDGTKTDRSVPTRVMRP